MSHKGITAVCGVKRVPSFYLFLKIQITSLIVVLFYWLWEGIIQDDSSCFPHCTEPHSSSSWPTSKWAHRSSDELASILLEVGCGCCSWGLRDNLCLSPVSWVLMYLMSISIKERRVVAAINISIFKWTLGKIQLLLQPAGVGCWKQYQKHKWGSTRESTNVAEVAYLPWPVWTFDIYINVYN